MTAPDLAVPSRRGFLRATAGLGLAAALAGCGDDGGDGGTPTPTPTPEPELEISRIQFVAERPTAYREYQPVQDKTYRLGGEAWVYFEPEGVASESADSEAERVQLTLEPTFIDADGTVIKSDSQPVEQELTGGQTVDDLFLWAGTPIPDDAAPGTWQVEIDVTDEVSGATASITREFEVEGASQGDVISAFGTTLEDETQIDIQGLEQQESGVALEYRSGFEFRTSDWNREVGAVAGIYVRFVGQGWAADRLNVTTTGSGGQTATWYVTRDTALAFYNDEISSDEFGQRVVETISTA